MPYILTTQSSAMCPHGGTIQLTTTANTQLQIDGGFALLQTDVHTISGCPFTLPSATPSPCLTVTWTTGATLTKVNQIPVLLQSSKGLCIGAGPQGSAVITNVQTKVQGT